MCSNVGVRLLVGGEVVGELVDVVVVPCAVGLSEAHVGWVGAVVWMVVVVGCYTVVSTAAAVSGVCIDVELLVDGGLV